MPECTCRTICSFGEQPRSTSSPTWPTFLFTMMPDWTFQKWYITPSFLGGLGWAQCPFLLRSEIAAVKWGTKSHTWTSREPPALQLSTSQFKSRKLLNGNTQTNYCHQLRAQCLSISAVLGWGQKWGATWVPVGSGRGMWYLWEMMALEANAFITRLPGPGLLCHSDALRGPICYDQLMQPVLTLKDFFVSGEAQIKS